MKIIKFIKRNLKGITIISVIIIISSLVLWKHFLLKKENTSEELEPILEKQTSDVTLEEEEVAIVETVYVDIKGEVMTPGVYEIGANKKVIDVIQLAGGFTEQADTSFRLPKMLQ